jgi:acetoin utilization deacetylase AcuC-like enzyme
MLYYLSNGNRNFVSMILAIYSPHTLLYRPKEFLKGSYIEAYECPERIEVILKELQKAENEFNFQLVETTDYGMEAIRAIHSEDYIEYLQTIYAKWSDEVDCAQGVFPESFPHIRLQSFKRKPTDIFGLPGYYSFDMSTCITDSTFTSAYYSAQVAIHAAKSLLDNKVNIAFALSRPPGHHCERDLAGGYCFLNNAAIATQLLVDNNFRVGILDLDFHHGNGTQTIFYERENPCYTSIHGKDQYPYYTGYEDEVGEKEGKGWNLNVPLPLGTTIESYLDALEKCIERLMLHKSNFIVISLGLDTFNGDPLGGFFINSGDYYLLGEKVGKMLGRKKYLIILEGGYVLEFLGKNVINFLIGLKNFSWENK